MSACCICGPLLLANAKKETGWMWLASGGATASSVNYYDILRLPTMQRFTHGVHMKWMAIPANWLFIFDLYCLECQYYHKWTINYRWSWETGRWFCRIVFLLTHKWIHDLWNKQKTITNNRNSTMNHKKKRNE